MRAIPIPVETSARAAFRWALGYGVVRPRAAHAARTPQAQLRSRHVPALGSTQRFVCTSHRHAGHGADATHDITTRKSEFPVPVKHAAEATLRSGVRSGDLSRD